MRNSLPNRYSAAIAAALILLVGCAGPGPDYFPPAPLAVENLPDGGTERAYDPAGGTKANYRERLNRDGRVCLLRYDLNNDGKFDLEVPWGPGAGPTNPEDVRHLIIILDSFPYELVKDLWDHGRFRLFHPPVRTIAPFPVMTDLSLSEFFGVSPTPGVEAQFFDGERLNSGFGTYACGAHAPWLHLTDYHLWNVTHILAYLSPSPWYDHELRQIENEYLARREGPFIGYVLSSSSLGISGGRDAMLNALIRLDRFCQWMVWRTRGSVQITLLSDHGHNLAGKSKRLDPRELLTKAGYHVGETLERPGDVVVPAFGEVTCGAVHTRAPAQVANDLVGGEGIYLTAYRETAGKADTAGECCDSVVVLSRDGQARITRSPSGAYRYVAERGDPLKLCPILADLTKRGLADSHGYVADRVLFEATMNHVYPDAVHRLWRAFHGLIEHTPDVLFAIEDGRHFGSKLMSELVGVVSTHGNLNLSSSCGFAMTTVGKLPAVMRMPELSAALRGLGVPLKPEAGSLPACPPKAEVAAIR